MEVYMLLGCCLVDTVGSIAARFKKLSPKMELAKAVLSCGFLVAALLFKIYQ